MCHRYDRLVVLIYLSLFVLAATNAVVANGIDFTRAFHRNGQTFLTFREVEGVHRYHLYRSKDPITTDTLSAMRPLELNGEPFEIRRGSSRRNVCRMPIDIRPFQPQTVSSAAYSFHDFIGYSIDPINVATEFSKPADPVNAGEGLVVWTPASGYGWEGDGEYYYAVTAAESKELGNTSVVSVDETNDRPKPVLVWQSPTGNTRVYQQFMALQRRDGVDWNPYFMGYAFLYSVEVPEGYDYDHPEKLPVYIPLHGGSSVFTPAELSSETKMIRIQPNDRMFTWWFGWSSSHDYTGFRSNEFQDPGYCLLPGDNALPTTGPIVNYTEMQILRALFDVADNPCYSLDEDRIFAEGPSMGATGALLMGLRYPNIFTTVLADKPVINFRTLAEPGVVCNVVGDMDAPLDPCHKPATVKANLVETLIGKESSSIPVYIQAPWMSGSNREHSFDHLRAFSGMPVYHYMDFVGMLTGDLIDGEGRIVGAVTPNFADREKAFLMLTMGMRDCASTWDTQGRHLFPVLNRAGVGYSLSIEDTAHSYEHLEFAYENPPEGLQVIPRYASPSFSFDQRGIRRFNTIDYSRASSYPAFVYTGDSVPAMPLGRPIPSSVESCEDFADGVIIAEEDPLEFGLTELWRGEGLAPIVDETMRWSAEIKLIDRTLIRGDLDRDGNIEPPYEIESTAKNVRVIPRRTQRFRPHESDTVLFKVTQSGEVIKQGDAELFQNAWSSPVITLSQDPVRIEFTIKSNLEGFLAQ